MNDRRVIYPANNQFHIPIGESLTQFKSLSVEPRMDFIRNHDESCISHAKGHFDNHNEVYWFCSPAGGKSQVFVSNPSSSGNRKPLAFTEAPTQADLEFVLPLENRGDAIIVAKTATPGEFNIYTQAKKLDTPLKTGGDPAFQGSKVLRAVVSPRTAKKANEIYFYAENVSGGTNIYKYNLADSVTTKIELKTLDTPLSELVSISNAMVSPNYLSFTGKFNDKTIDFLKFIFFQSDDTATNQIQNKQGFLTYRNVPQEVGGKPVAATAQAWAIKYDIDYAHVFVYNKTPRNSPNVKPYIEAGQVFNSVSGHVNDKLQIFNIGTIDNDPQLGLDLGITHLVANKVRVAWMDPTSKDVKNIWEIKWDQDRKQGHALTRVNIREGFKQLVFVFPDHIVGLRQHFEYNFNHFNYIFDPSKLDESQKVMDRDQFINIRVIEESTIYSVQQMSIVYHLVDQRQMKAYSREDSYTTTINAIKGTTIEFQVPELNFRGNNLDYSVDTKGNGFMIYKNPFTVEPANPQDKIQVLDEMYGQSINGKTYNIHLCDLIITTDIKVKCKEAAKSITYTHGDLKQVAQANSLFGIYTAFEGKNPSNLAEIPIAKYVKKSLNNEHKLDFINIDFQAELGGKPDLVAMAVGEKKVIVLAIKGHKIAQRELDDNSAQAKQSFDLTAFIPSFKGQECKPIEISKTDFYNTSNLMVNRAFITYDCASIRTIVDWRTKANSGNPNIREIINYPSSTDFKTCVTKQGILEMNTKEKTLRFRSSSNGDLIDYAIQNYNLSTLTELNCEHPGEGHALIRGTSSDNKAQMLMINLGSRDPLDLVFQQFEPPSTNIQEIFSARHMNFFFLTFIEKDGGRKYLLLNPGDKQVRLKANDAPYDVVFTVKGHKDSTKKQFTLNVKINPVTVADTKISQFPGEYTDFNELRRYDIDTYLKYYGPVTKVEVSIPESLKSKMSYNNSGTNRRIEVLQSEPTSPDFTIVIPQAQVSKILQASGVYVYFRSNEFETELKEVFDGVNEQQLFYTQEPCEDVSYDQKGEYGVIVLSCLKSLDVVLYVQRSGVGRLTLLNTLFMAPSLTSSVAHIDKEQAVIARSVKSSDTMVTINVSKVKLDQKRPASKERTVLIPQASASIDSCKQDFIKITFRCYFPRFYHWRQIRDCSQRNSIKYSSIQV